MKSSTILFCLSCFFAAPLFTQQTPPPIPRTPAGNVVETPLVQNGAASQMFSKETLEKARRRIFLRQTTAELFHDFRFGHRDKIPPLLAALEKSAPNSAELRYFRGLQFYQSGQKIRALVEARASAKINTAFDPAWNLAGIILMDSGRLQDALENFMKAAEAAPYEPVYVYNLAHCLYRKNQMNEALIQANRAVALRSNFSDAYYLTALIFKDLSRIEDSMRSFGQALALGNNSPDFLMDYLELADSTSADDKVLQISELLSAHTSPVVIRALAGIRMKYGENEAARQLYEKLLINQAVVKEDRKNLLLVINRLGQDPYRRLGLMGLPENEKKELETFIRTLEKESYGPQYRDPILNPAK